MSNHCAPGQKSSASLDFASGIVVDENLTVCELFDASLMPLLLDGKNPGIYHATNTTNDPPTHLVRYFWDGAVAHPMYPLVSANIGGQATATQNVADTDIGLQNQYGFVFSGCMLEAIVTFAQVGTGDIDLEYQINPGLGMAAAASGGIVIPGGQTEVDVRGLFPANTYVNKGNSFRERLGYNSTTGLVTGVPVGYTEFSIDTLWGVSSPDYVSA